MKKNQMHWAAFTVNAEQFVDDVLGLWARVYYPIHAPNKRDMVRGGYEIVQFVDSPLYYIREMRTSSEFTKDSCLPEPFEHLTKAKRAVEMLVLMAGD